MIKNFIKNIGSHFIKSYSTCLKCSPEYSRGSHFIKSYSTCLKRHIKDKCAPVDGSLDYSRGSHFIKSYSTCLKCSPEYSRGALLLELLVVISILGIILAVVANSMSLSFRGNKTSGENGIATSLASETLEAVRSITEENYQNIYGLTKTSQHYYLTSTDVSAPGRWITKTGDETVVLNGVTYTRYFIVDNVSRDDSTRNIQYSYSSTYDDPSTQKVTVTVNWTGGAPIIMSEYFFRWKNKICGQPGWVTIDADNTLVNCTDTSYFSKDAVIDVTGGTLKLQ